MVRGKTVLADSLVTPIEKLGRKVIRASVDGFHNPRAVRNKQVDQGVGYFLDSFNYEAVVAELLTPLGPGGSREYRPQVFDYRSDSPVDLSVSVAGRRDVLLFDGVFLMRPELEAFWDLTIWIDAPFEITSSVEGA